MLSLDILVILSDMKDGKRTIADSLAEIQELCEEDVALVEKAIAEELEQENAENTNDSDYDQFIDWLAENNFDGQIPEVPEDF